MTRVLFNCDDLGRTPQVNAAILRAHREGLLGSASLMVTGSALDEAVEIARAHPTLKVGLHLALTEVPPSLPPEEVPDLVDSNGCFPMSPGTMGVRLAFSQKARLQAVAEIAAQFGRFAATGLQPCHVDGHHHLHMHPFVFQECLRWAEALRFKRIRVVREIGNPLPPRRDRQGFLSKLARHWTFLVLARENDRARTGFSIQALDGVLGLWETSRVSEDYLLRVIPQLPAGDFEIYMHLGSPDDHEETAAMLSPRLKDLLRRHRIACL